MNPCYQLNDSWRTNVLQKNRDKKSFQDKAAYLYAVCHRIYPLFHEQEGVPPCPDTLILGKTKFLNLTQQIVSDSFNNNTDLQTFFKNIGAAYNNARWTYSTSLIEYIKITEKHRPVSNLLQFNNWLKVIERFKEQKNLSMEFDFVKDASFDYGYDSTAGTLRNFVDDLSDAELGRLWTGYPEKE